MLPEQSLLRVAQMIKSTNPASIALGITILNEFMSSYSLSIINLYEIYFLINVWRPFRYIPENDIESKDAIVNLHDKVREAILNLEPWKSV